MKNKLIYIDMDDTLADFRGHPSLEEQDPLHLDVSPMYEQGFFFSLKPVKGSLKAVRSLLNLGYDVHVLSQPVANSPHSYIEKVQWVAVWFPELLGKIHFTQDKGLFVGDYLIDDNLVKWKEKFEKNGGEFIHFDYKDGDHEKKWQDIVNFFSVKNPVKT